MPKKVDLSIDGISDGPIMLPEAMIGNNFSEGAEVKVRVSNVSDSMIRRIAIGLEGEGAQYVSLAREQDGKPGVWAAPGEAIIAYDGKLPPNEGVDFWARGVYDEEGEEGTLQFEFVVETISGS